MRRESAYHTGLPELAMTGENEVDVGMALIGRDHALDVVAFVAIIGIEEENEIARRHLEAGDQRRELAAIALADDAHLRVLAKIVVENFRRFIRGAIIDDDHFRGREALIQRARHRLHDKGSVIVGIDQYRYRVAHVAPRAPIEIGNVTLLSDTLARTSVVGIVHHSQVGRFFAVDLPTAVATALTKATAKSENSARMNAANDRMYFVFRDYFRRLTAGGRCDN